MVPTAEHPAPGTTFEHGLQRLLEFRCASVSSCLEGGNPLDPEVVHLSFKKQIHLWFNSLHVLQSLDKTATELKTVFDLNLCLTAA
ncbi:MULTISPECIES: hypothetical protein [unclassified Pseudomonas]|uniref:hypothetical protein n=1 Tax=unclassified Pseudomonas TaxID=196821 RepID=UPI0017831A44|nr:MULTISPECIES: hypothetical protein [unclassified Pseudomonas]MBD8710124.1 hypothetical protein [Pseudomonas sp. CFBP 13711]MBD8715412.1 hypothetical protein [Pseudomonas sp. CFBP 13715]